MQSLTLAATATQPGLRIAHASTTDEFRVAGDLITEYVGWCRRRYQAHPQLVDRYFGVADLAREVADAGQTYAAPDGAVLIATAHDQPAGCVALRSLGSGVGEVKRLYVRPEFQGFGIGRSLVVNLVALARRHRFRTLRLETGDLLTEAQGLYRTLGFQPIDNYSDAPRDAQDFLLAMETDIAA